jgi:hypothetical protein
MVRLRINLELEYGREFVMTGLVASIHVWA